MGPALQPAPLASIRLVVTRFRVETHAPVTRHGHGRRDASIGERATHRPTFARIVMLVTSDLHSPGAARMSPSCQLSPASASSPEGEEEAASLAETDFGIRSRQAEDLVANDRPCHLAVPGPELLRSSDGSSCLAARNATPCKLCLRWLAPTLADLPKTDSFKSATLPFRAVDRGSVCQFRGIVPTHPQASRQQPTVASRGYKTRFRSSG